MSIVNWSSIFFRYWKRGLTSYKLLQMFLMITHPTLIKSFKTTEYLVDQERNHLSLNNSWQLQWQSSEIHPWLFRVSISSVCTIQPWYISEVQEHTIHLFRKLVLSILFLFTCYQQLQGVGSRDWQSSKGSKSS